MPENPYKAANQLRKALRIILTVQTGDLSADQIRGLDENGWKVVLLASDVKDASPETRELVAQGLEIAAEVRSRSIPVAWVRAVLGDVSLKTKGGDVKRPTKKKKK